MEICDGRNTQTSEDNKGWPDFFLQLFYSLTLVVIFSSDIILHQVFCC